jgi:hypothetical protein
MARQLLFTYDACDCSTTQATSLLKASEFQWQGFVNSLMKLALLLFYQLQVSKNKGVKSVAGKMQIVLRVVHDLPM